MKRKVIGSMSAILLGACVIGTSAAALAADGISQAGQAAGARSTKVFVGDLNLATAAGVKTLYQRLEGAAHRVCETGDLRVPGTARSWEACYNTALDNAVEQVNNVSLTRLHAELSAKPSRHLVASEQ